ncbi:MAG: acyltransferase [Sphingomonas bacterium]|nr:acyltransferase [Sphingomonas bacterium]
MPVPRDKLLNLQILRFIAAFGVLASHAADLTLDGDSWFWRFPWTAGVDIFFVISGMIMTIVSAGRFGEAGAARHFLIRRIVRIAPIYWLFTALMIATVLLLPGQVRISQSDPASIVTSLLFVPWPRGDGQIVPILAQGWTLNYEAFFYLAFALALLHHRGLALLAAAFALLAMAHAIVPPSLVALRFWSDPIILEFIAGIGLAKLWLSGVRLRPAAIALLAAASLTLFAAAEPIGLDRYGRCIANGIPAAILCSAFLFAAERRAPGPIRRILVAGGDASYALYLSHTFTINAVILMLGNHGRGWAAMTMSVAVASAMALIIHRLVERPMLGALRRRRSAPVTGD